jgi:aryl-alcohol dehydrogenase-like predicted oxidoreductase
LSSSLSLSLSSSSSSSSLPLLDKDGAWKRSYRALKEMYHHGSLENIGIGKFGPEDMRQLFELATVGPHVYQGLLRTLLTQEGLIEELVRRGVHYHVCKAGAHRRRTRRRPGDDGPRRGGEEEEETRRATAAAAEDRTRTDSTYICGYRWRWDTSFAIEALASSRGRRTRRTLPRTA